MSTLGMARVRFHAGTAIALIFTDQLIRTSDGYDDTRIGYACFPGRPGMHRVHRIGHNYWKQLGA